MKLSGSNLVLIINPEGSINKIKNWKFLG